MQTPDAFQWQRSTLSGIAVKRACMHLSTRPSFVSWSSRAYWPIGSPITGRQEPCPRAWRSRRGAGSPLPGARYLRSTLCTCRPHLPRRAPTVPGANVIRPGGVHTRGPQRWLRSPHTVCSPAFFRAFLEAKKRDKKFVSHRNYWQDSLLSFLRL